MFTFYKYIKAEDIRRAEELFKLKSDAVRRTNSKRLALSTFPLETVTGFLEERAANFW